MFPHVLKHFMLDHPHIFHWRLEAFQTPASILRSRAQPISIDPLIRRGHRVAGHAGHAMDAPGNVTQQKDVGGNQLEALIRNRIYTYIHTYIHTNIYIYMII